MAGFEGAPEMKNPYEGLDTLSVDELKNKVGELSLDQLTWLNAKLEQDQEAVNRDLADPKFKDYEIPEGKVEPILVNGKTGDQLSLERAQIESKLEAVKDAMKKESSGEMSMNA